MRVCSISAPDEYQGLVTPLPPDVRFLTARAANLDLVHVFVTERRDLERQLTRLRTRIRPTGMIWVSWPKRSSGVASDVSEDTIRAVAFPLGLVDVKVCAVDETWSGLRLVIRRELR